MLTVMPFCNWCQLETADGDVCAWCKRPLRARSVYGSFDFVREGEGVSSNDRFVAITGGVVLLAVLAGIGFAIVSSNRAPKDVASLGGSSSPVQSGPSVVAGNGYTPAPAPPSVPTPIASKPVVNYASAPPPAARNSMRAATPESVSGATASNTLLSVTEARFRVAKTVEGKYILYGEIDVENTASSPVTNTRFALKNGSDNVLLRAYEGEIYHPKTIEEFAIPMGKSTIFLINEETPASILNGAARSLDVDGKSSDGPVEGSIRISQGL